MHRWNDEDEVGIEGDREEKRAKRHALCEDVENGIDRSADRAGEEASDDHCTKAGVRIEGGNASGYNCIQGAKTEDIGDGVSGVGSGFTSSRTDDDKR